MRRHHRTSSPLLGLAGTIFVKKGLNFWGAVQELNNRRALSLIEPSQGRTTMLFARYSCRTNRKGVQEFTLKKAISSYEPLVHLFAKAHTESLHEWISPSRS